VPTLAADEALEQFARAGKMSGDVSRPLTVRLSLSRQLPVSVADFALVLRLLAPLNCHVGSACDFLLHSLPEDEFPVRVHVPLLYGFYAEVSLRSFAASGTGALVGSTALVGSSRADSCGGHADLETSIFEAPTDFERVDENDFLETILEHFAIPPPATAI